MIGVAECFRGDGEIMANPIGTIPAIGGRLARDVFEPDLVMTDGEALLVANGIPLGVDDPDKTVEAWNPYRTMFDVVWSGRRHVMMGASQLDPFGNQNFAFIGDPAQPKVQLLGMRGAPGNTVQNITSYWIPNHSPKVFVEKVDVVSGIGYDRAAELGEWVRSTTSCGTSSPTSRCSTSTGPTTACACAACTPASPSTRSSRPPASSSPSTATCRRRVPPTAEELEVIARLDPTGMRSQEVPG